VVLGANSGKHRTDLAEMLLVDGFGRTKTEHPKLQDITNMSTGAVVPADMTATSCKQKPPVTITSAKDVQGWGISFGNYELPLHADMAIRGRLLSDAGIDVPGTPGVIRMPGKAGFAAVVWNMDQQRSLATCARYRAEKAPCEVLTPEVFSQIAALVPESSQASASTAAQGSDASKIKKKKRIAKKKKKN
jgi:hypothetical protein